jgi:hypothetical protein
MDTRLDKTLLLKILCRVAELSAQPSRLVRPAPSAIWYPISLSVMSRPGINLRLFIVPPYQASRQFIWAEEVQQGAATPVRLALLPDDGPTAGVFSGGEAFDLLQLLNTGHSGTLSTVHASSAAQALARFTSCVLQSGIELPYRAIKSSIADSLNVLIQLERRPGERFIAEVLEICSLAPQDASSSLVGTKSLSTLCPIACPKPRRSPSMSPRTSASSGIPLS